MPPSPSMSTETSLRAALSRSAKARRMGGDSPTRSPKFRVSGTMSGAGRSAGLRPMRTFPRMNSHGGRRTMDSIRCPPTKLPLVLSRSRSRTPSANSPSSAWKRETLRSDTVSSASAELPIVRVPQSKRSSESRESPLRTRTRTRFRTISPPAFVVSRPVFTAALVPRSYGLSPWHSRSL